MGFHAPAVMLVSFIPMLLIAAAYYYMNRADPDCGTSFTWVTRAMGPRLGWLTGWAIVVTDVIVMAALAYIAGVYTFLLFGLDAAATNLLDVSIVAAIWIIVMTWICYVGIELSARTQYFLLAAEIAALAVFAAVALAKVYFGDPGGFHVQADWFNPFTPPRRHQRRWSTASSWECSSTGAGTAASASTRNPGTAPTGQGEPQS